MREVEIKLGIKHEEKYNKIKGRPSSLLNVDYYYEKRYVCMKKDTFNLTDPNGPETPYNPKWKWPKGGGGELWGGPDEE